MKILYFIIVSLVSTTCLLAQGQPGTSSWTSGTAMTLSAKRVELRLSELSSYGITDRVEISARPLLFWLMPQLKVKIRLHEEGDYTIASEHQLNYPTMFLNLVSKKGIGGLISPEFDFPQMVSLYNGVVISRKVNDNCLLTAKAGFQFSIRSGKPDGRSTIDLPILFPRFAVYYHNLVFMPELDLRGKISSSFGYIISANSFIIPGSSENLFLEHRGRATWTRKNKLQLQVGYLLCFGRYPFGTQWHLLPSFELIKAF